nr:protein E2 [Equid gammaherpesvirus 5]
MIFLVVLASIMANMASGALQAWMPESYTGSEGKPLAIKCYFSGADCAKNWTVALYKTIPNSAYFGSLMGTHEHPFKGGTAVFTASSLSTSDEGRYGCVVAQPYNATEVDLNPEKVCPDYHTAFTKVIVTSGPVPPPPTPAPFSVRAVKKRTAAYTDITLHAECQYSGVVTGASITATLYKKNSDGDYVLATPATTTLTTMDRSLVIDGTGQTKWCSKGCTTVDTGSYKCEISMDKTGMEKQTLSDTFDIKVFEEPGEDVTLAPGETEDPNVTDDDYDYVYE